MTPGLLIRRTADRFRENSIPDPETDSALLLAFLLHREPLALRLDTETTLSSAVVDTYNSFAERRLAREPLQYILNEAPFCGRMFYVDPRVLIPRPETELLCRWALELPLTPGMRVLDLCCGSGCIGLTIAAERPGLSVILSDISGESLDVASVNAGRFGINACLHQGDLFSGFCTDSFDLIVSNPPYIPADEMLHLQPEVRREPTIALDGGNDGLTFYRRIISEAPRMLSHNGFVLMELGHREATAVRDLFLFYGYSDIEIRKDLEGIDRMILASAPVRRNI